MRESYDEFEAGSDEGSSSFNFRRVVGALRRRQKLILIGVLLLLPLAPIPALLEKEIYVAKSTVAVERPADVLKFGREVLPAHQGLQIGRVQSIATSDRVLGRVVDQMPPLQEVEPGLVSRVLSFPGRVVREVTGAVESPTPDPAEIRQQRIASLRGQLKTDITGGRTILEIVARSYQAEQAAWLVNAVADSYIAYERDEKSAAVRDALTWLTEKIEELKSSVQGKEQALASLGSRLGATLGQGEKAAATRDAMIADSAAARLELIEVEQRLGQLSHLVTRDESGQEAQRELRKQLENTIQLLEQARLRFTPTHPEVVRLAAVVDQLRAQVAASGGADPLFEQRLKEYRELQGERGRLQARVAAIGRALETASSQEGSEDNGLIAQYQRLESEVTIGHGLLEGLMQRRNETIVSAANEIVSARVIDYAMVPPYPEPMKQILLLLMGLGVAIALPLGLAFGLEFMDGRDYEGDAVIQALGVPLLQEIPIVTDGSEPERQSDGDSQGVVAECYRNLRTAILFQMGRQKVQSLVVTSAVPGEGKTTTAINLAAAFGQTDRKVLLVDADMRRPRHSRVLGIPRSPGLSEVLAGEVDLEAAIRRAPGVGFDSLMSGSLPANPAAQLASPKLPLLLARLHQMYDTVVIDAPVILAVSDALVLSSHVSGTLYVSKPGSVDRNAFKRVKESLDRAGANVLGVVLTHVDPSDPYLYPAYLRSPYSEDEGSDAVAQS